MRDKLIVVFNSLSHEQQRKEIIEIEYTADLDNIIGTDKIRVKINGKTNQVFIADLGIIESYNGEIDLVYKNK